MAHQVETCMGNRPCGSETLLARVATTWPDVKTREWGCLANCHRCYRVPFALLDEFELIEAPTQEALWAQVAAYLAAKA